MKENRYDDAVFFEKYSQVNRSRQGLSGAGEWGAFKKLLPDFAGKRVLDLGCGYGWHCKYAAEQGAARVSGVDLSRRMIVEAKRRNPAPQIEYRVCGIEDYDYPEGRWNCVVSNLALHYIADLDAVFARVYQTLKPGGVFLFNIEHPCFTAGVHQEWICDSSGNALYRAIDDYFLSGERRTNFLGCEVRKQHHTLTQILMGLLKQGFELQAVEEAQPSKEMLQIPGMSDELRRPMMLLVKAKRAE